MPPLVLAATMMLLQESEKVQSSGLFNELIYFRNEKTYTKQYRKGMEQVLLVPAKRRKAKATGSTPVLTLLL